jgi:putative membrane protein
MIIELIIRYFHFIGIFFLFASLVSEHLLIEKNMTRMAIKRLSIVDMVFGFSVAIVLVTGLLLWLVYGKPALYYGENPVFHTKVFLFVIIGLLSIYPTFFFLKNRKGTPDETVGIPKRLVMMIRLELLLVTIIPLLAVIMAKGIPYLAP